MRSERLHETTFERFLAILVLLWDPIGPRMGTKVDQNSLQNGLLHPPVLRWCPRTPQRGKWSSKVTKMELKRYRI